MTAPGNGHKPAYSDERQICCTLTSVLLRTVRRLRGEAAVQELLEAAGSAHDPAFLENTDNWICLDEAVALMEAGVEVCHNPRLPRMVGADAVRQHAGTQVATLLRSLGSPEKVLESITAVAAKYSTVSELEALETGPGRAVVRSRPRPGFTRAPVMCEWSKGLLSQPCMLFGLPEARVQEEECCARGGTECRYVISWDEELAAAASDPEQRVTSLEAQVVAMAERLENVYATASDLVSPDDLDIVLARIVERAANAVRAPGYLLAVRSYPGEELRVFSEGLSPEESERIAAAAADGAEIEGTALCVEVASSQREYGWLVAVYPEGMQFLPQEHQLLALYGKHAAAVLDTAVALEQASRRHQHVSTLLSLSQSLAQAGGTQEIGLRLSQAVGDVIDCDSASLWIWDDLEECLRCEGARCPEPPVTEIGRRMTPLLGRMLDDPRPMFISARDADPVLETIMTDSRLVALAVVPIIAREIFLGMLAVGVTQQPDRLAGSPEVLERLNGVAALAATALQNARLIDELGRQVVHDGLTGVMNRTGFEQVINNALDRVSDHDASCVGLLYVDLDNFKSLNDEHGHQFGDALLVQVASRLRASFRGGDTVARLGGDEFAVILPRVCDADDLHQAAERVKATLSGRFSVEGVTISLTASVGEALAPDDGITIDTLVRHADAAMYREKTTARLPASRR